MKIGIFSDIHGNIYAFEKVFQQLRAAALDRYIFCGDLCGYYYHQNAIVDMLESFENLVGVIGNHDQLFLRCLEDVRVLGPYTERYGTSLQALRQTVSHKTLSFLRRLPDRYIDETHGVAVFHGSPWDPCHEYVYPTDAVDRFADLPYRYVVLGHTHHAMLKRAHDVVILNPGSCGQPRDMTLPSYAILDVDSGDIELERVSYDPKPLLAEIKRRGETNPYLSRVLQR